MAGEVQLRSRPIAKLAFVQKSKEKSHDCVSKATNRKNSESKLNHFNGFTLTLKRPISDSRGKSGARLLSQSSKWPKSLPVSLFVGQNRPTKVKSAVQFKRKKIKKKKIWFGLGPEMGELDLVERENFTRENL